MDEQGNSLPWKRSASGEWTVVLSKPTAVSVSYQLYANELGQRVRHIDASHAFLDASGVFMYSPEFRQEPLKVTMDVPADWRSYSGMAAADKPIRLWPPTMMYWSTRRLNRAQSAPRLQGRWQTI